MLKTLVHRVSPAFNGSETLPRIYDWDELRRSLAYAPLNSEPEPARLSSTPLGARYARMLGRVPRRVDVTLSMETGPEPKVLVELRLDACRDRWELEVDGNGLVTGMRSDLHVGDWAFSARGASQFLEEILGGL